MKTMNVGYMRSEWPISRHSDAMPCIGATVDDLDIAMFRQLYLPKAVPEDVLREDGRDVELQLQSLGFLIKGTVVRHTPVYCFR